MKLLVLFLDSSGLPREVAANIRTDLPLMEGFDDAHVLVPIFEDTQLAKEYLRSHCPEQAAHYRADEFSHETLAKLRSYCRESLVGKELIFRVV